MYFTALEGFGEGLHKELLLEWNIKVITVQPGGVKTEWAKGNMVDRPLSAAYDTPESPANKMRNLYNSTPPMGDAVKRMFTLFECPYLLTDVLVDSQPGAHNHLPGSQPSSQIAFGW